MFGLRHIAAIALAAALAGQTAAADEQGVADADPVVAVVNGEPVHRSDVVAMRGFLAKDYQKVPLDVIYPVLLERLIDQKLVALAARESGIQDDPDVIQQIARLSERLVQEAFLRRYLDARLTDEVLRSRYDEVIRKAPLRDQLRVRHILLETQEEALEAIQEIRGGVPFAEVARRRSISPSASKGGSLGYIVQEDVVPEFASAAFALEAGEYSQRPVHIGAGWQVILVEERRIAPLPTFEKTRDKLIADLSGTLIAEYVRTLRQRADVVRYNLDGTPRRPKRTSVPLPKDKPVRTN